MKTTVLLFFSGLAVGVGGMLILRPPAEKTSSDASPPEAEEIVTAEPAPQPSPERKKRWARKHRHRWGSSGDARTDLETLLTGLSEIDDESELNLMDLIRRTSWLTRLSETEALDILHFLTQPTEQDRHIEDDFKEIASVIVFSRLCELNGPEAMRLAVEDGMMKEPEALAMGMNSWVAADPEGAQRWFEGMLGKADQRIEQQNEESDSSSIMELLDNDDLRQAYINGMAKHDAEGIESRISNFKTEQIRDTMREDLMANQIARENTADGLLVILNKSTDLQSARNSAIEKLAEIDADQAAEWVVAQPPCRARDHEVTAVGVELMQQNPDTGAAWFMSQDMADPEMAKNRMSRIVYQFAADGLPKAEDWVNRQPDSPIRDYAEVAVALMYSKQNDWQTTFRWLSDVSDQKTREQQLDEMFKKNWDNTGQQLSPELFVAAQAAGFGDAARSYTPE